MKPIERIEQFIIDRRMSISQFERSIGASNNSIGTAIRRKTSIKDDTIISILNAYKEIDATWLLLGKENQKGIVKGCMSDYTNLEIMEYVHDNMDNFKSYPYFKTLFDIAYWKENVKEFKIAIQKGKDEASSVRDKNNHSNKF
jgi:plasmid maintenance system antidote protein VapI